MIFTETKILVHFYKKFQDIIILFHDIPGRVVTLHVCKLHVRLHTSVQL